MKIDNLTLAYFSPTGSTKSIVEAVARGICCENSQTITCTTLNHDPGEITFSGHDLVIIATPVYGGRLPVAAIKQFRKIKAHQTLAILIVVYGNREFEDALLELYNLSLELGFIPLACAAFVGEHSFSTKDVPIAQGRPDSNDLEKASDFGGKIQAIISSNESFAFPIEMTIPGRFPYESQLRSLTTAPVSNQELCNLCGTCAQLCPASAISLDDGVLTITERCIHCCACIKKCPSSARSCEDPIMKSIAKRLSENCLVRKEPQIFGIH